MRAELKKNIKKTCATRFEVDKTLPRYETLSNLPKFTRIWKENNLPSNVCCTYFHRMCKHWGKITLFHLSSFNNLWSSNSFYKRWVVGYTQRTPSNNQFIQRLFQTSRDVKLMWHAPSRCKAENVEARLIVWRWTEVNAKILQRQMYLSIGLWFNWIIIYTNSINKKCWLLSLPHKKCLQRFHSYSPDMQNILP